MNPSGYDIIGDIHGCFDELTELLRRLGYRRKNGAYRHPSRHAVFVGDLIDRGPKVLPVLELVAAMVEEGSADCLLGNHERDAIFYHGRRADGKRIRRPLLVRRRQLEATHAQLGDDTPLMRKWVRWMEKRPLVFEVPGLRVIHAAWHPEAVDFWRHRTLGDPALKEKLVSRLSWESRSLADLVFGPVLEVPITDKKGPRVLKIRARWHTQFEKLGGATAWHAAFRRHHRYPRIPLPETERTKLWGYAEKETPLIFGHQSLMHVKLGRPLRRNLACVDYGGVYGGHFTAYRWSGETSFNPKNFLIIPARRAYAPD